MGSLGSCSRPPGGTDIHSSLPLKIHYSTRFAPKEGNGLCTKPLPQLKQNPHEIVKMILKAKCWDPHNYLHYPNSLETVLPLIFADAKLLTSNQRQVWVFWMYPSTFSGYLGKSSIITTDSVFPQLAHARALEVIFWKVLFRGKGIVHWQV